MDESKEESACFGQSDTVARAVRIAVSRTDMVECDLIIRFIVKLFDTWRVAGPLDEACNAKKAAVSDDRHNIQEFADVF